MDILDPQLDIGNTPVIVLHYRIADVYRVAVLYMVEMVGLVESNG